MSMQNQATSLRHQTFQPFPRLGTPLANEDGTVSIPWYRFLISLWNKLGQGTSQAANAVYLALTGANTITAYESATGNEIAVLATSSAVGGPAVPVPVGASPFTYTALVSGTLVVFGARVDLSRDNGVTFYPASLVGGPIPLVLHDVAKLSWFSAAAPTVTWLPSS